MARDDPLRGLLDRSAEGDDIALGELIRRTQPDVYRVCAVLGSKGEEEDLVQETYLRMMRSVGRFRGESSVRTWLLSIARFTCADAVRRRQRQRRLMDRLIENTTMDEHPDHSLTAELLETLSEDRREAFALTQMVGLSYEEAASVIGCPVGTVRSRVSRARADLMAQLDPRVDVARGDRSSPGDSSLGEPPRNRRRPYRAMIRERTSRRLLTALAVVVVLAQTACGRVADSPTSDVADQPADSAASTFAGYVRSPAADVSGVELPDADGEQVRMVASDDGLRLVFFGYTTCPDVCPATLGYVKMALASLSAADRKRVDVDMITVDPTRDDPATLTRYVEQFVPEANAIRTEDDDLLQVAAEAFGASYDVSFDDRGRPEVSHTGDLYAVDDRGQVVLAWPFGSSPTDIETDLHRLLAGERPDPRQ